MAKEREKQDSRETNGDPGPNGKDHGGDDATGPFPTFPAAQTLGMD